MAIPILFSIPFFKADLSSYDGRGGAAVKKARAWAGISCLKGRSENPYSGLTLDRAPWSPPSL